jgi:putative metallohydrolase (TIGR04338 family)
VTDAQRERVYQAEYLTRDLLSLANVSPGRQVRFFGSHLTLPREEVFDTLAQVEAYLRRAMAHPDVAGRYGSRRPPGVRERKGQRFAHAEGSHTIAIPTVDKWALRELVVLHELAHILTPGDGHGPSFAACHLHLISSMIGPEVAWIHRVNLLENGVKVA